MPSQVVAAVERGLIEFYLRWNNICDQYGFSYALADVRLEGGTKLQPSRTSPTANRTTVGELQRRGSACRKHGTCLRKKCQCLPVPEAEAMFPGQHYTGVDCAEPNCLRNCSGRGKCIGQRAQHISEAASLGKGHALAREVEDLHSQGSPAS